MTDRIQHLEEKVLYVLDKYPKTRNDDVDLTLTILWVYLPDEFTKIGEKVFVGTTALRRVREDNVKRVRAKIQNDQGKFLPTDPDVRKKRKITEEDWFNYAQNG